MQKLKVDESWSFENLKRKETNYASHGYHKYPAKFIPQLVQKLLSSYSKEGDVVFDPFGGCGTTLVESKIYGRNSICTDVNEIALLISSAKKTAIHPEILKKKNIELIKKITLKKNLKNYYPSSNPRLKYWFNKKQFNELMGIFNEIKAESNNTLRTFYYCCFSNILKNCSIWYSKSIKPMKDPHKQLISPLDAFQKHLDFMTKQNEDYFDILKNNNHKTKCTIKKADARNTGLSENSIDLIITSPPYATSYEYADLHQLSLIWFGFTEDINQERKKFIGTSARKIEFDILRNLPGFKMLRSLEKRNKPLANQIRAYISDLKDSFEEMHRVLKIGKKLCLIIGDTEYKGVKITNSQISIDLLKETGFSINKIIKRKLSSKTFTPYRDSSGKFTNSSNKDKKRIYQYEYVVIATKQ